MHMHAAFRDRESRRFFCDFGFDQKGLPESIFSGVSWDQGLILNAAVYPTATD